MDSERWQRIKDIYTQALDTAPAERAAFVDKACGDDSELAREVMELLAVPTRSVSSVDEIVDAAAAEFDGALQKGERVGPYRILGVLGKGGMGHVYLAERADEEFEQRVAIKMVSWVGAAPSLFERFRLERQILATLEHPNIARLLDGGRTDSGVPYLVMEYVEGNNILAYANDSRLSVDERLELFLKICDAVQYAHRKLVVHRDI